MSLTAWLTGPHTKRHSASPIREHPPHRQSTCSRPTLEHLEQRTLLDASSGLFGGVNNLTINGTQASSGATLPIPSNGFHAVADNGTSVLAATADLLAQDQPNSQFRLFAVNSQGQNFQLLQTQFNFLTNSEGFGSGTWPGRPWMPAAYNVGLANRQFGFPSQADHGFPSAPPSSYAQPGTVPLAQSQPKQQQQKLDDEDNKADEQPEQVLERKSTLEQEETPQKRTAKDIIDQNEDGKPVREESAAEKDQPADQVLERDLSLPNSLWLSVLAPAPVTALVAGLPGTVAEAEGGDIAAEAPE